MLLAHERDYRLFLSTKRHMVLVGFHMEEFYLTEFLFRRRRDMAFPNLIHDVLSGNPVSRHVLDAFRVGHRAGVSDQLLLAPGGQALAAFRARYRVNRITILLFFRPIIVRIVRLSP